MADIGTTWEPLKTTRRVVVVYGGTIEVVRERSRVYGSGKGITTFSVARMERLLAEHGQPIGANLWLADDDINRPQHEELPVVHGAGDAGPEAELPGFS